MKGTWSCLAALGVVSVMACDSATGTAEQCSASDLIGQCPAGSNPVLGSEAAAACGGSFELKVVEEAGAATGQCQSTGTCNVLCQYESPCSCGVAELSKDRILCAECPEQSCGDGRCEGTERPFCDAGQESCFPCLEDCGGSTCGDGDCTGSESPETCPQDCANGCVPNEAICVGTKLQQCSADGSTYAEIDCATSGQVCAAGACVQADVCGNGVCEAGEDATCAKDCAGVCTPASVACEGNTLVTCSPDGQSKTEKDCAEDGLICANGQCVQGNVCGNSACEPGEDSESCPDDCGIECGNDVCEVGEQQTCPEDCVVCGDGKCGAGEQESCPQDCGVCVPSETLCLGDLMRVCSANGTAFDDVDCTAFDMKCKAGKCVEPDVCGNDACEVGEEEVCPADCAEICGDGTCQPGESFTTCSLDCDPVCGDGSCNGGESAASCAGDCLESCGNGACDPLEDRQNCPNDCGFCGDGTCDDGYESPSLTPPGSLETCLQDCVASGCSEDADCNDGISCTVGSCVGGVCAYSPDDGQCGPKDKCIKFSGCCPDEDQDGFADVACGGSDCDDGDPLVYPGAYEACGLGDRNCNGTHKPALGTPVQLTASFDYKQSLHVIQPTPGNFVASWTSTPEATPELAVLDVKSSGELVGAVSTVPKASPSIADKFDSGGHMSYSPQTGRVAFVWSDGLQSDGAFISWRAADGSFPLGDEPIYLPSPALSPYQNVVSGVLWLDGNFIVTNGGHYVGTGGVHPNGWHVVSEAGGVTQPWILNDFNEIESVKSPTLLDGQVVGIGLSSFVPAGSRLIKASLPDQFSEVTIAPESYAGDCILSNDGEALVHVCDWGGKIHYNRLAPNGAAMVSEVVSELPISPRHVGLAQGQGGPGASKKVGVVATELDANIYLFVRDQDGSEVLAPGIVAGGASVADPHVFHDGDNFVVFWLADKAGVHQLYQQVVTCE